MLRLDFLLLSKIKESNIRPQSAKQKGRLFQQWVRDKILEWNPELHKDDVRSTSMGAGGEDVQLSPAARKLFPYQIECKSKRAYAVYKDYAQAGEHGTFEPVLILKANGKVPMAVVTAEHFFDLVRRLNEIPWDRRT